MSFIRKRRSLVLTSTLALSILFLSLIAVMVGLLYKEQKNAAFHGFTEIGAKLSAQAQVSSNLIASVAGAYENKQNPQAELVSSLQLQLNAMIDDDNLTNAYYMSTKQFEIDGQPNLITMIQSSLSSEGSNDNGTDYPLDDVFLDGYHRVMTGETLLTHAYSDDIGTWISYLAPIKDDQGNIVAMFGLDYDYDQVKRELSALLWGVIGIGMLAAAVAIGILFFIIRATVRPLGMLAVAAQEAAQGNLTISMPVTSSDEIGRAAASFNDMIHSLRQLTSSIKQTSDEVTVSSLNLKEFANQSSQATQEITIAIQTVASSAEAQFSSSQETQRAMTEMAIGIQRITESSAIVSDLALHTSERASEGEQALRDTVHQMNSIQTGVLHATDTMQELQLASGKVDDILTLITEVAGQTNLLALNASIEAARAGEHGKGFAVVAQEIRKLAERSRESSDEIRTILQAIKEKTAAASAVLEGSAEEARTGTELVQTTGSSIQSILASIKQVSDLVQDVSAACQQMSAGSEQIAATMVEQEQIAKRSSTNSHHVAAASEEQLASVEEVSGASEQLRVMASKLGEAVSRFVI
ncbi:methyl-accepting chemotaxis protein [Paenibacillus sp. CF384]|uniref:methyl-accepting chemotaxis protein n=1 Tax=Paenibacillus sp. CF384 TaxID=1884382 RepID=UPI000894938E|nr:methyl-accepting chemotaxis protein [Paenibacillus sp. CF384]SDX82841.1 methyl-accepting chemotaxis protein [Paenibacillus sp. CF384]